MERLIAQAALESDEIKRLMTVPGVGVIVAASFLAAIGNVERFKSPRKLVGYLGLDPRVSQSGSTPASHGRISKQGSSRARHALVEACWSTVRQPGPIRAFYERIRARRGYHVAIVACARKLACLFWCLLTREEDYAYAQPSLTKKKLRRLEITAGAQRYTRRPAASGPPTKPSARAERELARQAELAYTRTVRDWHAAQAGKEGASVTKGARIKYALRRAKLRGRPKAPDVCASLRHRLAPTQQPNATNRPAPTGRQTAGTHSRARKRRRDLTINHSAHPRTTAARSNALRQAPATDPITHTPRKIRTKPDADPLDLHPSRFAEAYPGVSYVRAATVPVSFLTGFRSRALAERSILTDFFRLPAISAHRVPLPWLRGDRGVIRAEGCMRRWQKISLLLGPLALAGCGTAGTTTTNRSGRDKNRCGPRQRVHASPHRSHRPVWNLRPLGTRARRRSPAPYLL